jgi:MFS family permease
LNAFVSLLGANRNYRNTWIGQVVSEIGDHFNNIAVFSLALANTKSGLVVSGIMLARAIPAMLIGPAAGVVLDRMDRKRVMIASDLTRAAVALAFIFTVHRGHTWLLYLLSALLMGAPPFCPPSPPAKSSTRPTRSPRPRSGPRSPSAPFWAAPAWANSGMCGPSPAIRFRF